jgi:predicted nucleic acid-binding Zn ribbon protein
MVHRRDPFPLADALGEFTKNVQPASVLAEVQRGWPEAVGETIAGWATPVAEKSGIIVIECDDSVVAHELEMMKSDLLKKLAATLPDKAPRDLKFRVK